jgi:hypothetical protein
MAVAIFTDKEISIVAIAKTPPIDASPPVASTNFRSFGSGISSAEYLIDDILQFGRSGLMIQEIANQLGVGKLQKFAKCLLIGFGRGRIARIEVTDEELVELAHSTPALPPKLAQ